MNLPHGILDLSVPGRALSQLGAFYQRMIALINEGFEHKESSVGLIRDEKNN